MAHNLFATAAFVLATLVVPRALSAQPIFSEDFEAGLDAWRLDPPEQFEILTDPGTSNRVLQLAPNRGGFAHALIAASTDWRNLRFEGRFLFPTEGDGYLGFLYNYQETADHMDFGCLYVKSNGSYVRVSPHHDGNPSWRLYEELRFDLEGERRIQPRTWYPFRLDVRGNQAKLYIGELRQPVVTFDLFPHDWGAIGLEARPGGGEPVWVDDLRVSTLEPLAPLRGKVPGEAVKASIKSARTSPSALTWEILTPLAVGATEDLDVAAKPELLEDRWRPIHPDPRGALITGFATQYRSGDQTIAYLRTSFEVAEERDAPTWRAVSSANRLDVYFNGYYRGTVAPERFIWPDFVSSPDHPGARIPIAPTAGRNELVIRVHGDRFAGGGFYAAVFRR
jgi:hypothetical protein